MEAQGKPRTPPQQGAEWPAHREVSGEGGWGSHQHLLRAQVHEVHVGAQAPERGCGQGHHSEQLLSEAGHRLNRVTLNGHPLLECL